LVTISQSRCSPSDLLRMQTILANKLEMNPAAGKENLTLFYSFSHLLLTFVKCKKYTGIHPHFIQMLSILEIVRQKYFREWEKTENNISPIFRSTFPVSNLVFRFQDPNFR
jgi:hypothetical protein